MAGATLGADTKVSARTGGQWLMRVTARVGRWTRKDVPVAGRVKYREPVERCNQFRVGEDLFGQRGFPHGHGGHRGPGGPEIRHVLGVREGGDERAPAQVIPSAARRSSGGEVGGHRRASVAGLPGASLTRLTTPAATPPPWPPVPR
ncbi:hypothetical protein LV779_22020 [Streptomyces thinghirensis]|nr:hypothetical protein [Streptomyces thinghirensis]